LSILSILHPAGRAGQETSDDIPGDDLMATTLFNKTALANGTSNLIVRSAALNLSTDLVQAGAVFNDAVRDSTGLFNLSGSGNQNPFLGAYTTDIHAIQNDIAAMLANAGNVTLGGQAFALYRR
jgi:trimeric autotransporter adhesin